MAVSDAADELMHTVQGRLRGVWQLGRPLALSGRLERRQALGSGARCLVARVCVCELGGVPAGDTQEDGRQNSSVQVGLVP